MNAIRSPWLRPAVVALLFLSASTLGSAQIVHPVTIQSDDSLVIKITQCSWLMRVEITRADGGTLRLRNIRIDSAVNAQIRAMEPFPVPEATTWARVEVGAINSRLRASAIIEIKDSTLRLWHVPYQYEPELLVFDPAPVLDFGDVAAGTSQTREIAVINPTRADLRVDTIRFARATGAFRVSSSPTLPIVVPRDSGAFALTLEATAPTTGGTVWDTLVVATVCEKFSLPIRVTSEPINAAPVEDPAGTEMSVVSPNPTGSSATIIVQLAAPSNVRLSLTDARGREVRLLGEGPLSVGSHTVRLATDDLPAGVYYTVLVTGSRSLSRQLVVVK